jgi:hypothetical protein
VSKPPKGNPNPRFHLRAGRARHVESGSPVTITPVDLNDEDGDHWLDVNAAKLEAVQAHLPGLELWSDGRRYVAVVGAPNFALDAVHALVEEVAALRARIAKLEKGD